MHRNATTGPVEGGSCLWQNGVSLLEHTARLPWSPPAPPYRGGCAGPVFPLFVYPSPGVDNVSPAVVSSLPVPTALKNSQTRLMGTRRRVIWTRRCLVGTQRRTIPTQWCAMGTQRRVVSTRRRVIHSREFLVSTQFNRFNGKSLPLSDERAFPLGHGPLPVASRFRLSTLNAQLHT